MEALAIPVGSLIIGGAGLMITVFSRLNSGEREELRQLRIDNENLRQTVSRLRDENVYLQRKALGLSTNP